MYNLLISADDNAWESPFYEYEGMRIFEYTPEYYKKEFDLSSAITIKKLIEIPTLFVHEMFVGKSKIGFIKSIKKNYNKHHITLEFVCEISSVKLSHLQPELGIDNRFEISRTHWAIKDIDLIKLLLDKRIITYEQSLFFRNPIPLNKMGFDIAFSFPGEKREMISRIVEEIKARGKYTVFYDRDFVEQLAVPDMDLILMNIYKKQSRLICILISKEYESKKWCQLEWKAVREIINERRDSIMFLRYDETAISGVSSNDGYIDINQYSPEEISIFIQARLRTMEDEQNERKH
jgi:hypothetical protein